MRLLRSDMQRSLRMKTKISENSVRSVVKKSSLNDILIFNSALRSAYNRITGHLQRGNSRVKQKFQCMH